MKIYRFTSFVLILLLAACNLPSGGPTSAPVPIAATTAAPLPEIIPTDTPIPPTLVPSAETLTPTIPAPTDTPTPTDVPVVESLKATVTADQLSCRYGPGAEYLYLYGLNKGAKIELTGQAHGNNWVMVKGKNLCWVNAKFLEIQGDPQTLRVTYPGEYELPESPYYAPPAVLSAERSDISVTVTWTDIELRTGDKEDADMFIYLIEVWRCEGGRIIFDTLASNYPEVTFVDESGCAEPSHGRVFFQEKHGFAGPADIPWP